MFRLIFFCLKSKTNEDWLHVNSVDYNEELDQIVLSVRAFGELWIIDHSTTTLEASGHTGGNSGKGGDILYRWGNPQTYNQGTANDQKLFGQHDANWITDGYPNEGKIMIFNNQAGGDYSTVDIVNPPIDATGNYIYTSGAYLPNTFHWTYQAPVPTDLFSANISGAHPLPNGNALICEGVTGRFFEVDSLGNTVWEYVNPVNQMGAINQGVTPTGNRVFRATRYSASYPAFVGQTLIPQGYIESGSTFTCELFTNVNEIKSDDLVNLEIHPNPASSMINISANTRLESVSIYNLAGQSVLEILPNSQQTNINISDLQQGLYLLKVVDKNGQFTVQKIIISQ